MNPSVLPWRTPPLGGEEGLTVITAYNYTQ